MTIAHKKAIWTRAASLAALVAWFMLFGQTISHAEHMDHADTTSHLCLVCSIGGPEDDLAPPVKSVDVEAPKTLATLLQLDSINDPTSTRSSKTTARAPPRI